MYTARYGLIFEGILKTTVSSNVEVGKKIARNMYKNPLNMNPPSVDNILCAWHGDITNLARTKCNPDLAEQVLDRAAVLASNWR